jgi:hypothetical protein
MKTHLTEPVINNNMIKNNNLNTGAAGDAGKDKPRKDIPEMPDTGKPEVEKPDIHEMPKREEPEIEETDIEEAPDTHIDEVPDTDTEEIPDQTP